MTTDYYAFGPDGDPPSGTYSISNTQDTSRGNMSPSRRIEIETTSAPVGATDKVYAVAWITAAKFNPSEECAVSGLAMCVEQKIAAGAGGSIDGATFFIRQDSRVFAMTNGYGLLTGIIPTRSWKKVSGGPISSTHFVDIENGGSPNFSSTGSEIEFGVGLSVTVLEGEETRLAIRLDNLCIGLDPCGVEYGCLDNDGCDYFLTSSFGPTLELHCYSTGGNYTPSVFESSFGNPDQSIAARFEFPTSDDQTVGMIIKTGILLPTTTSGCKEVDRLTLCFDLRGRHNRGGVDYEGSYGLAYSVVFQDGLIYFNPNEWNGEGSSGLLDLSYWRRIGDQILDHSPGVGLWHNAIWNPPVTGNECESPTYAGGSPDFDEPFELGFVVATANQMQYSPFHSYNGWNEIYLDNICVKVHYKPCIRGSLVVDVSGITLGSDSGSDCEAGLRSSIQSAINSTFVCTFTGTPCIWRYNSGTSTVNDHQMRFTVEVHVTQMDGCSVVSGYVLVIVETRTNGGAWISETVVYQLSAAADVSVDPLTFDNPEIANDAPCVKLSAANAITVEMA